MLTVRRWIGFFRVEGAGRGDKLDETDRAALVRDLALARQKREAARHLFHHGARADALALAVASLASARRAAEKVPAAEDVVTRAASLARAIEVEPLPELDDDVRPAHDDLLEELLDASLALESDLADATLVPRAARTLRGVRQGVALALLVVAGLIAFLLLRKRPYAVEASATAEPALVADHLIDGDQQTEWALPDQTAGFVDFIPSRPRSVRRIRILNSKNLPGPDRGTREFRVEVTANGKVEKLVDESFTAFSREPQWKTIELGVDHVQRIRVVVKSWFGAGGGLTEVVVD